MGIGLTTEITEITEETMENVELLQNASIPTSHLYCILDLSFEFKLAL